MSRRGMASTDVVDRTAQAAALERPPLLIREPLEEFLNEQGIGSGPLEAERIGEGHSNVTFLIRRGNARVVLRRPPRPPLPPSAHDVVREARLLRALAPTAVPVPRVLACCEADSPLGVPFYVMEEVAGTVVTTEIPPSLDTPDQRRRIGEELIDVLVEIHAVDWRGCGLEDFGRPAAYLERQLRRFFGLWEHNKTRELPVVTDLARWLGENLPDSPPATIVHGDYRLGNVMLTNDRPARVAAVLDWELSTIGDPLADLGYFSITWPEPGDNDSTMLARLASVVAGEGFATRGELIARYEARSGRSMAALGWYQAFALWKAAIFMEGNYKRFLAGGSDDSFMSTFDEGVPALAQRARELTIA
jgi:aminoglycoside phosphotransferase (APT) family kinase protein